MTKSTHVFLGFSILILLSVGIEAASKTSSVTKCVDAAGNVTFTTMGCKSSETNASATTPTQAAASAPTTTSTPHANSSTQTNSEATTSSSSAQQPIAEPDADASQQDEAPTQQKREKLGEGSPDSVGVGGMGL